MFHNSDELNKYNFLRKLSNDQLKELLRQTTEEEHSDMEYINFILEVMEEREKGSDKNNLSNIDQAWDDFQKVYNSPECESGSLYADEPQDQSPVLKPKRIASKVKKLLLVAIIACLSISMMATALGYNIFQAIGQWTKDVFSFDYAQTTTNPPASIPVPEYENYESLQEALDALNITEVKAPTWLPPEFTQVQITPMSHLTSEEVEAIYANEDLTIFISITTFREASSFQYEKDDNPVEEYIINGVTHYIFTNIGQVVATWNANGTEGSISGDISLEEMKKILNSMY